MPPDVQERLRELARRAGLGEVSPAVVLGALVLGALALALAARTWWPDTPEAPVVEVSATAGSSVAVSEDASAAAEATRTPVLVHVVGAVRRPGVYELVSGDRAIDAVNAAGGLIGDAAPEGLNLARQVSDGEQIFVPRKGESPAPSAVAGGAPAQPGAAGGAAPSANTPVNINTADAALLDTLPGVGPSTAAKIVADREANGPFSSPEDLGRVSGIGPKKLDALAGLICVR